MSNKQSLNFTLFYYKTFNEAYLRWPTVLSCHKTFVECLITDNLTEILSAQTVIKSIPFGLSKIKIIGKNVNQLSSDSVNFWNIVQVKKLRACPSRSFGKFTLCRKIAIYWRAQITCKQRFMPGCICCPSAESNLLWIFFQESTASWQNHS